MCIIFISSSNKNDKRARILLNSTHISWLFKTWQLFTFTCINMKHRDIRAALILLQSSNNYKFIIVRKLLIICQIYRWWTKWYLYILPTHLFYVKHFICFLIIFDYHHILINYCSSYGVANGITNKIFFR